MAPFAVFLLFSVFIIILRVTSSSELNQDQKAALLTFITKLTHHNHAFDSWTTLQSSNPCSSWKGVTCDPSGVTVTHLKLPAAGLTGEIPPHTIGHLYSLRVLSLPDNHLNGTIPSDFEHLTLDGLYLQNNMFSGHLPGLNGRDLKKLDLSNNAFNCSIPPSLSRFPESAFSGNENLCGFPLPPCDQKNISCPVRSGNWTTETETRVIASTSVGLGLLLLILLCYIRKKIHQQRRHLPKPSLETPASAEGEGNKRFESFDDGINGGFDVEDLLRKSAEVLGKGSVGTSYKLQVVLEAKNIMTTVVVKRLRDVVVTKAEFESQMEVLGKMMKKNEYVVPLRAYYYSNHDKWVVYDYMPLGSLSAHLHGSIGMPRTRLDWANRTSIALSTAKGVAYLHVCNIVHGNLKSSNVFLRQETNKDALVAEYGLNTLSGKWSSPNHRVMGYLAPEVLKTRSFSFKSDVYSFGILLLELLTGKDPNQASMGEVWNDFPLWVQSVVHEEPMAGIFDVELRRDQNIKEMFKMLQIAKDCVSIGPHQRPTMHKVVSLMEEINTVEMID